MKTSVLLLLVPLAALGQMGADRSPFLPSASAGSALGADGPGEQFQLTGASNTSQGTQICLFDTVRKHSLWVSVGQAAAGVQVVSYDAASNLAMVRFDGREHQLALRKAPISSGPGAPFDFAGGGMRAQSGIRHLIDPATVGKSPEILRQEREARMMVSDLLDIGMQQRKAYEEAQKKAKANGGS